MAATTISRASLTDGVTVWNAAVVGTAIYDKIDAVLAGSVTFGGVVRSEGFGNHELTAGGTGGNLLFLRNTTSGTGNYAGVTIGNNASSTLGDLLCFSSAYTTAGANFASGVRLGSNGAGGISIAANDATGEIRFYAGGGTLFATLDQYGRFELERGFQLKGSYDQEITGTQALDSGGQHYAVIRLTSCTSTPKISSCTAGNDGDIKIIVNVSGAACTVQHSGGGPTTRMYLANATDGTLGDDESMMLMYDAGTSSWLEIGPR